MKTVIRVLCLIALQLTPTSLANADAGRDLAARSLPHVVTVRVFDATATATQFGSGFWVGNDEIVTNAHVLAGGAWAEIHAVDGQLIGTLPHAVLLDLDKDLAVLSLPDRHQGGLPLAAENPGVGQTVWAFGAPLGLEGTVSTGIISATRDQEGRRMLQMTAPISQGSSGGPVVDDTGAVVGISAALMTMGQNLNFAVPVSELRTLLEQPRTVQSFPVSDASTNVADPEETRSALAFMGAVSGADSVGANGTYEGSLEDADTELYGPIDAFRFQGVYGLRVEISVSSRAFDPSIILMGIHVTNSLGEPWCVVADGTAGHLARIAAILPATGQYHLFVRAVDGRKGDYKVTLSASEIVEPVAADRWIQVANDADRAILWNRDSVAKDGSEILAWVRFIYYQAQVDEDGKLYNIQNEKRLWDCTTRRMKVVSMRRYLSGQAVSYTHFDPQREDWQPVVDETWAQVVLDAACTAP